MEEKPAHIGEIRYTRCVRCNLSMRIRVRVGNPDAVLMRYSETGVGLCASCAAALFLHSHKHIKKTIDEKPTLLVWKPMQEKFASMMQAGNADAKPEEINWQHVMENWSLPFPKPPRKRKKKGVPAE